jgi:beta-galactosidase GanA
MMQIPHLVPTIDSKQLVVQGRPFLIRGAELQNSSFTSAKFMREIWPSLVDINLNTVLGCVTWEMIEPEEGRFDFSEIEQIIRDARHVGLKLILLWFGAWKNGLYISSTAVR